MSTILWLLVAIGVLAVSARLLVRWRQRPTAARAALLAASLIVPLAALILGWLTEGK